MFTLKLNLSFLDDRYPLEREGEKEVKWAIKRETGESVWAQEEADRKRKTEGSRGRVSQRGNQLSRQASHLYCQSPLPPVTGGLMLN